VGRSHAARCQARARHMPVRRVTHGDSGSLAEQPPRSLTCAAAGPPRAATSFAGRRSHSRDTASWTVPPITTVSVRLSRALRLVCCTPFSVWRGQTAGPAVCLCIATQVENSLICRGQVDRSVTSRRRGLNGRAFLSGARQNSFPSGRPAQSRTRCQYVRAPRTASREPACFRRAPRM